MNHEAPPKLSKKAHNVNTKAQSKDHMINKQVEEAIVHNIAQSGRQLVKSLPKIKLNLTIWIL
jgi:hypothetical protein